MTRFTYRTVFGPYGPIHTIATEPLLIHIVCEAHFASIAKTDCESIKTHCGDHFAILARCNADQSTEVFIKNRRPITVASIHRDDAWQKRLELARAFTEIFLNSESMNTDPPAHKVKLTPTELRHDLPMSLLTPVYLEAFSNVTNSR